METIAIVNQKGGAAKTTCAVNLGAALAGNNRSVLIIDLDSQCSASRWLLGEDYKDAELTSFDLFHEEPVTAKMNVLFTPVPMLSIIVGDKRLAAVDVTCSGQVGAQMLLREKMKELDGEWEYILLDCPPALGLVTINALTAAQSYIAPVADAMSLNGLVDLQHTAELVKSRLNPALELRGVFCSRVRHTRLNEGVLASIHGAFGARAFKTYVPESIVMQEAERAHQPVTAYSRNGALAEAYRALALEVEGYGK